MKGVCTGRSAGQRTGTHAAMCRIEPIYSVNSLNYPNLAVGTLSKYPHAYSETAFPLVTPLGDPEYEGREIESLPGMTWMLSVVASRNSPEATSMNDRQRAISILSYARDVLAER